MTWDSRIPMMGKQFESQEALGTFRDMLQTTTQAQAVNQRMQHERAQEQRTLADIAKKQQHEAGLQDLLRKTAGLPEEQRLAALKADPRYFNESMALEKHHVDTQRGMTEVEQKRRAVEMEGTKRVATIMHGATPETWNQRRQLVVQDIISSAGDTPQSRAYAQKIYDDIGEYNPERDAMFGNLVISPEKREAMRADAEKFDETKRHNRAMEGRPVGAAPTSIVITGEGGVQYAWDPRNPGAPARPVTGPDGKPVAKPNSADTKITEREVGGFTFDPKNPPSADASKKMAEAVIARDKIVGALGRLEAMFDEHGTELFGETASQMESEWKAITDEVRKLQDMGVPNGADYVMLAKQIPDPVGMTGAKQSNKSIKAKFGTLRKQVEETVSTTAKAYKYRPEAKAGVSNQPPGNFSLESPPSPGMVRIRDPKTGKTGWADSDAVPAGAEVVNGR